MTNYEVKDGQRTLQFDGELLGASSSWRPGSMRWIEFALYKTQNGSYILSRLGASVIYHAPSCTLVTRYNLDDDATANLRTDAVACEDCQPTRQLPFVCPEKNRTWAQVTDDAELILDYLYKHDSNNTRYLTKVAERVLIQAAKNDPEIDQVYRVEIIP
jgi:hypothetical protein